MYRKTKFVKVTNRDISLISKEIKKNNIIYYFADIADISFAKDNYMKTIKNNILNLTEILHHIKNQTLITLFMPHRYMFIVRLAHFIEPQNNVQKYW